MKNFKIVSPRKRLVRLALYGLASCGFGWLPLTVTAVTANISIVNFAFSPTSANINVNDSVKWTWVGSPHTTTSNTGLWDSGVQGTGATFTHTFASAGSFSFHCSVHPFMTGTISVQSANVPPTVAISNPTNGSVFAAPATLTLAATASDTDGSVTNVQFLQGAASLANVANSPYSVPVLDLGAGDYALSAVATDNNGSKATNSVTIHVVTPVEIVMGSPNRVSPSIFHFHYSANPGLRYAVERSADLQNWTPISTNTATGDPTPFSDYAATGSLNFYRVQLLPNP
jgi:plastocyanin